MEIEIEDKKKIGDYDALLAKLWKQPYLGVLPVQKRSMHCIIG